MQSLRGAAVILSVGTQPGGEVTSVLFVSTSLQPDLEMTNSAAAAAAAGRSQRLRETTTQMHEERCSVQQQTQYAPADGERAHMHTLKRV